MAPTAPKSSGGGAKRETARQKALRRLADPLLPRKLHRENNVVSDSFLNSKRDKRTIKHSAFVSKISKPSAAPKLNKAAKKRQHKKLVTTLESLGDALDDIQTQMEDAGEVMDTEQRMQGKVRHKSLKHKPGALKKKERIVRGEMERFGFNLAQLATVKEPSVAAGQEEVKSGQKGTHAPVVQNMEEDSSTTNAAAPPAATSNRWAALRGFISSTMEQNPAFLSGSNSKR
ncbi:ribosome biogenesis protein SLX9-domain-containing protein [Podospora australis]|uniref:Ribosome biogenesis protein SLX9 n=1 Tax=Podospora australis TaxID=1536484 RepID=A0AAN6X2H1_9PEZI|nr:ribosome biogenesis protein SLX9-domain-containing protein [Podospora australis]